MTKAKRPHIRVIIGRNITLTAGAIYALTRAATYATLNPADLNRTEAVITADGRILGLWAAIWFAAAALCVADMINRHTRYGLSMIVGIAGAWGIAYGAVWACTGFTGDEWVRAIGWLAPVTMIFGFLIKGTALQDMLRKKKAADE